MASTKQRIFINTMGSYLRSLVSLFLGIFTARWVLLALGATDFGLFAVVGTIITFITFINSVMSMSASRHLAYAIGQARGGEEGGREDISRWFNAALSIHVLIPLLLIAVGYPIGVFVIRHYLVIPPERLEACVWVFRFSLFNAFFSMASVPFSALYIARQRIAEQSMYGVCSTVAYCGLAYLMLSYGGDRLIFYAGYMTTVSLVMTMVYVLRSWFIFPESHVRLAYWWDATRVQALFSFASWNALGAFGWLVKNQGLTVLVNCFYGPRVNAAMGVAQQVSGQVNSLSNALMSALTPEIVSTEGSGNREKMLRLAMSANRFASILLLFFALPLCCEMDYVLTLWLKHPPEWSVIFCLLTLLGLFFNNLTTGHAIAMGANGKIAGYQITMGGMLVLALPFAWLGCRLGLQPWIVLTVSAAVLGGLSLGRALWAKKLIAMPIRPWLLGMLPRFLLLIILEVCVLLPIRLLLTASLGRLFLVSALSGMMTLVGAVGLILSPEERGFVVSKIRAKLHR